MSRRRTNSKKPNNSDYEELADIDVDNLQFENEDDYDTLFNKIHDTFNDLTKEIQTLQTKRRKIIAILKGIQKKYQKKFNTQADFGDDIPEDNDDDDDIYDSPPPKSA
jgi:hypothetical protein